MTAAWQAAANAGNGPHPPVAGNAWWFWLLFPLTLALVAVAVAWALRRDSEQWRREHGRCPFCGQPADGGDPARCPACGRKDLCPVCGYDLRATPNRCPECGALPPAPRVGARGSARAVHRETGGTGGPSPGTSFADEARVMETEEQPVETGRAGAGNDPTAVPFLERRLGAALCDVSVIGACCIGLVRAFGAPAHDARHPWIGAVSAAALLLYGAAELLTGVTPGKRLFGLVVRRRDGTPAPIGALVVRGTLRLLPVPPLLCGQLAPDPITSLWVCGVTLVGLGCYVPACYIMLMKTGRSMFDAAAGTVVERAGGR